MVISELVREAISKLIEGRDLSGKEAEYTMNEIMSGKATDAQIGSLLTALRMKVETINEITAFASVMRKFCRQIHPKVSGLLVDTCGTGGDRIKTFNISTTAAFVAAGAGIPIAKHGNRSVTSRSGSADVLESLGFNLKMDPTSVEKSIEEVGIGFMFAPSFHPAMKHAIGPRKEIGIRTVFNILGPLTNPANAQAQLLGVYDQSLTEPLANVLKNLGVERAMIVHGVDGLDEISTFCQTKISSLNNGDINTFYIDPEELEITTDKIENLEGTVPEESAHTTFNILKNKKSDRNIDVPKTNIVLINAAAAIQIGGKAETIKDGIELAQESIRSGSAYEKLRSLVKFSGGDLSRLEEFENNE
jgi:anthranilate phosphoribosyltransferase